MRRRLPGHLYISYGRRRGVAFEGPVHRLRLLFLRLPVRRTSISEGGQFRLARKNGKCTFCAGGGGPEETGSIEEYRKYGANRLAQGKLPLCAEMCSTKSLLAGDGEIIAQIYKDRVAKRGYGSGAWGWSTAYHETV